MTRFQVRTKEHKYLNGQGGVLRNTQGCAEARGHYNAGTHGRVPLTGGSFNAFILNVAQYVVDILAHKRIRRHRDLLNTSRVSSMSNPMPFCLDGVSNGRVRITTGPAGACQTPGVLGEVGVARQGRPQNAAMHRACAQ